MKTPGALLCALFLTESTCAFAGNAQGPADGKQWAAQRNVSCESIVLNAEDNPPSSVYEREALLAVKPELKVQIDQCLAWRKAHPVKTKKKP
ncbi:MAG: hypothetical protein M3N19_07440 [Candidatus Eremiobacteraeota bacterium]|nr:hypothetical protein [Candidatus Eremiobacteraeota bacterium]